MASSGGAAYHITMCTFMHSLKPLVILILAISLLLNNGLKIALLPIPEGGVETLETTVDSASVRSAFWELAMAVHQA